MLKLNSCDHSDAYILVNGTVTVKNTDPAANPNNRKNIISENCAPFNNCTSEINNTQIDNATDIDVVMPVYNLIEYSDNYSKTFGILWQYHRDEPFLNVLKNSGSFKFKTTIGSRIGNNCSKDVKIMVPLKYLRSNF